MMLGGLGDALTSAIASAITKMEGYIPPNSSYPNGSLAYQNNNPGNIRYVQGGYNYPGAVPGAGGFARYPDLATGQAALQHQIDVQIASGQNLTQFFNQYAPSNENNTQAYIASVASQTGIDPSIPLKSVQAQYTGPGSVDLSTLTPGGSVDTSTDNGGIDLSFLYTLDPSNGMGVNDATSDYTPYILVTGLAIAAAFAFTD